MGQLQVSFHNLLVRRFCVLWRSPTGGANDMGWEPRRCGRLYYYIARREGNRVRKIYCGSGERGRQAAEADEAARKSRAEAVELRQAKQRPLDELASYLDEIGAFVDLLVAGELIGAGWKKHHRQWRSTKNGRARSHH